MSGFATIRHGFVTDNQSRFSDYNSDEH